MVDVKDFVFGRERPKQKSVSFTVLKMLKNLLCEDSCDGGEDEDDEDSDNFLALASNLADSFLFDVLNDEELLGPRLRFSLPLILLRL